MKIVIFLIILIFSFFSCNNPSKEEKNEQSDFKVKMNGKTKKICHFEDDNLHGYCFSYYPNGKLESKRKYEKNKLVDTSFFYYESGLLKGRIIYINGKTINRNEYFSNGFLKYREALIYPDGIIHSVLHLDSLGNINLKKSNCIYIKDSANYKTFKIINNRKVKPTTINVYYVKNFNMIPDTIKVLNNVKNYSFVDNSNLYYNSVLQVIIECLYLQSIQNEHKYYEKEKYYFQMKSNENVEGFNLKGIINQK